MVVRVTALLILVFLSGCSGLRPGVSGSGISHTEIRPVGSFNEVSLSGFGTANVYSGESPNVSVTTDDNLLVHVETYVENNKLHIKPRGRIKPKTGLNVDVRVPHLTAGKVSGAGELNIIDVVSDQLELSISGAGNVNANGYVNHCSASISGAGDANLKALHARNADVRISGAGDASIYASESVKARVSGAGDIVCYGNPIHVDQKVSGAGDFRIKTSPESVAYTMGDSIR